MLWRAALLALGLATLIRCTPLPPKLTEGNYQQRLQQLDTWQLEGKLGLRLPDNNGSARLSWRQSDTGFYLTLSGPLGRGRTVIEGDRQQVTLKQAGQPEQTASDAESLLLQATGWQLPVSLLRYWVKGIPAPDSVASARTYTPEGVLSGFTQAGWTLSFKRHQRIDGLLLPGYIRAEQHLPQSDEDIRIVLSIHDWKPHLD